MSHYNQGPPQQHQYQQRPPHPGQYPPQHQQPYQSHPGQNQQYQQNYQSGPPPQQQQYRGGPPPMGRGPPRPQHPQMQPHPQQQQPYATGPPPQQHPQGPPQQHQYQNQPPAHPQGQYDQGYGQAQAQPQAQPYQDQGSNMTLSISEEKITEEYEKLQSTYAGVQNLVTVFEKQLATTKALAQSNQGFKETTRSIFGQNHYYYQESCRIVNVHSQVGQMYMRYVTELEEVVQQTHTWSNKYRIAGDRKKLRDKAFGDFRKAYGNYEKTGSKMRQDQPKTIAAAHKAKSQAEMLFAHIETQNKQLLELISELLTEKHEFLNKIVADYMHKSYMFHRKANQQFQTLASIDPEGHKISNIMKDKEQQVKDKELARFTAVESHSMGMSPAEQQNATYQDQPQSYDYNQQNQGYDPNAPHQQSHQQPSQQNQQQQYYDPNQYDPNLQYWSQDQSSSQQQPAQQDYQYQQTHQPGGSQNADQFDFGGGNQAAQQYQDHSQTYQQPASAGFNGGNNGGYDQYGRPQAQAPHSAEDQKLEDALLSHLPADPAWGNQNYEAPAQNQNASAPQQTEDIFGFGTAASASTQQQQTYAQPAPSQTNNDPLFDIFASPAATSSQASQPQPQPQPQPQYNPQPPANQASQLAYDPFAAMPSFNNAGPPRNDSTTSSAQMNQFDFTQSVSSPSQQHQAPPQQYQQPAQQPAPQNDPFSLLSNDFAQKLSMNTQPQPQRQQPPSNDFNFGGPPAQQPQPQFQPGGFPTQQQPPAQQPPAQQTKLPRINPFDL